MPFGNNYDGQGLRVRHIQEAIHCINRSRSGTQKAERRRRRCREDLVRSAWSRIEPQLVLETKIVSGADMKGAFHIQGSVRAENHSPGVEEIQVRSLDGGTECAVDRRGRSTGDTTYDIPDAARSCEGRAIPSTYVEGAEAVEKVLSGPLAQRLRYRDIYFAIRQ